MKKLGMGFMLLNLGACATYNTEFECRVGQGVACQSVSQINEIQEKGYFDPKISGSKTFVGRCTPTYYSGLVKKSKEKVQRLWVAGFEDEQGFYHGPKFVYAVMEPSQWIGEKGEKL